MNLRDKNKKIERLITGMKERTLEAHSRFSNSIFSVASNRNPRFSADPSSQVAVSTISPAASTN